MYFNSTINVVLELIFSMPTKSENFSFYIECQNEHYLKLIHTETKNQFELKIYQRRSHNNKIMPDLTDMHHLKTPEMTATVVNNNDTKSKIFQLIFILWIL